SIVRLLMRLVVSVAVFYFTFWIAGASLTAISRQSAIAISGAAVVAVAATAGAWKVMVSSQGVSHTVLTPALVGGALGFLAGFVGPMLLTPNSAQGPLLGIFITGPFGVLVGVLVGTAQEVRAPARAT